MSSHREAPESSKDPVADNTDVYAFISPDAPDSVTLIANFLPFQKADGGPNFYEFGNDVAYRIHVSNRGDAHTDVLYEFRFHTAIRNPHLPRPEAGRARPQFALPAGQRGPA